MTTKPASVDFWLYLGATFQETITLKDADGALIDLTGYTARMQIRRDIADANPVLTLSTDDSTLTLGSAAGTIVPLILPATSAAITVDWDGETWVHDLLLSNDNLDPVVIERTFQGSVYAMPGVTRP